LIEGLRERSSASPNAEPEKAKFAPKPAFSKLIVFSASPSDAYPTAIPPWEGLDYRFYRSVGAGISADTLATSLLDCLRAREYDERIAGRTRIDVLTGALAPIDVLSNIVVEVENAPEKGDLLPPAMSIGGKNYLRFFGHKGEQRLLQLQGRMTPGTPRVIVDPVTLRDLSSGEEALLRFAIDATAAIETGSFLIFDEPETHMHPRFISLFIAILDEILEASRSIAIVATHSAFLVREVPARRVRIARRSKGGEISIEPPGLQTFGASIDSISQFVFEDIQEKHLHQRVLDKWMAEQNDPSVAAFKARFEKDLTAEVLSYVAQTLLRGETR